MDVGLVKSFSVDGPRSQQQLTVTVTATGAPVNVHIVRESDHQAVEQDLVNHKKIDAGKLLASKDKVESDTLEATIPAKTGFSIFVSGAKKKADVKVKIVGK